ncbi:uncharacterized protein LOC108141763 [Drosophila elegans]|uniref:uncharacterized protein LOC108141763 n=1 Tax=Drosophila elegans TaxID=30023 RepID=UPI0007E69FCC|nr:uncharacterized protein LOC108141763 [Drosophila elegans]
MFRTLLLVVVGVTTIWATDYNLVLEEPEIFSSCFNGLPGAIGIHEAINMDNLSMVMEGDGIDVSGNASVVLSFPSTDRISSRFEVMKYNRGSWEPTVFNMLTPDFCDVMFDKDQYWYKYWFKYVRNREEIQEKCLKQKGTLLVMDPFVMVVRLEKISGPSLSGRYKGVFTFEIFDKNNVRRPTSLCFEIKGELEKIKN